MSLWTPRFGKIQGIMLSRTELARRIARHVRGELYDDSGDGPLGTAIYSLSDPADLKVTRYIGQSAAPKRRFLQHLATARLWMPDERPWWITQPRLRPLYEWIRDLYFESERLPTMVIHHWVDSGSARVMERARILESLAKQLPLLNVEQELLGRQRPLL